MAKERVKKPKLKERNPYAYYRNQWLGYKGAKWLSIIAPFVTIFAMNWNKYFYYDTGSQVKMSLGCTLACFVGGIAMWKEMKKSGDGKGNDISNVLGWAVAFALCYLFQSVLQDLTLILGCALIGQLVGLGFEFGAKNRAEYMGMYKEATIKASVNSKAFKSMLGIKGKEEKEIPYE